MVKKNILLLALALDSLSCFYWLINETNYMRDMHHQ
jgi:hypothetical protein